MGEIAPPRPFWEAPLATLDAGQWEALCDGCGKCCLHKLEDEDTGRIYPTNVACHLLALKTARCGDYKHRRRQVPDCLTRSEEHTYELQSLMRISYAVFCLKKTKGMTQ